MSPSRVFAMDGSVAVLLACALGLVYFFDRAPTPSDLTPNPPRIPETEPGAASSLRLAVTPHQYDDMGSLLGQLGSGFTYTNIRLEDLEDVSKLVKYDVVFLTCGTVPDGWVVEGNLGEGDRPGVQRARPNKQALNRVKESLRTFVARGGTLYASDWRLNLIQYSFPELFDGQDIVTGAAQTITAEVVDPGLRDVLGPTAELRFDLPGWYPAGLSREQVTIYLRGSYRTNNGGGSRVMAPLLVKALFERGTIIFTSFHNEKVNSELETKLLWFLVFAAVTAKETAQAQTTMIAGGFSPQKQDLLSASPETPSVTKTYTNAKRGRLQFVLSFADQGARLQLNVRSPEGRTYEQEGASTFTIDVDNAELGNWTYKVTAVKIPYPNYPFTLTIGGNQP